RVEALSPLEVSLLHSILAYDRELDELLKVQSLPYWEAQPMVERALGGKRRPRSVFEGVAGDGPVLPLDGFLVRAGQRGLQARPRLDRRIAALRCVEAVRLHAAAHGGRWPGRLADVADVPVPPDPATGKPFDYRVEDDRAYLSGPDVFGKPNPNTSV